MRVTIWAILFFKDTLEYHSLAVAVALSFAPNLPSFNAVSTYPKIDPGRAVMLSAQIDGMSHGSYLGGAWGNYLPY